MNSNHLLNQVPEDDDNKAGAPKESNDPQRLKLWYKDEITKTAIKEI